MYIHVNINCNFLLVEKSDIKFLSVVETTEFYMYNVEREFLSLSHVLYARLYLRGHASFNFLFFCKSRVRHNAFLSRCAQSSYLHVLFRIGNRRKWKVIEKHSDNCINGQYYCTNLKFINAKALSQSVFIETNILNIFCAFSKIWWKLHEIDDYIARYFTFCLFKNNNKYYYNVVYGILSRFSTAHTRGCVLVGRMIKILVYGVYIIAPRSYPTREILF